MLGDFDADGDTDVLSGSYPGQLYLFRQNEDGSFADGETLKDKDGEPINAARASTVYAADWDADGDLDLVLGSIRGEVYLVLNEGTVKEPAFGPPEQLELEGDWKSSNSGPIVADWDDDGLNDLLVGLGDGSVHWFRNVGSAKKPEFSASEMILEKSGFGFKFADRKPGQWGARVKLCATDFNGDGRLDLLLGDRSGSIIPRELTEEQEEALEKANQRLRELPSERARVFSQLRQLQQTVKEKAAALAAMEEETESEKTEEVTEAEKTEEQAELRETKEQARESQAELEQQLQELQEASQRLSAEYSQCRRTVSELGPQTVRHGFVWLFLRKPAE